MNLWTNLTGTLLYLAVITLVYNRRSTTAATTSPPLTLQSEIQGYKEKYGYIM